MLPIWLSPVQVVVIPIADRHKEYASKTITKLRGKQVRAVLDDRSKTLGWRVREASKQWVPFIVVIGDKEVKEKSLTVTVREESKLKKPLSKAMKIDSLVKTVRDACLEKPFKQLLSKG